MYVQVNWLDIIYHLISDLQMKAAIPFILTRSGFDAPDTVETGHSLHHTVTLRIVQSGSLDLCTERILFWFNAPRA